MREGFYINKEHLYQLAIAERIRKSRQNKGMSIDEIANKLLISRAEYEKYETTDYQEDCSDAITKELIAKIAIILDVSFSYLCFADEDGEPKHIEYKVFEKIIKWQAEHIKLNMKATKGINIAKPICNKYNNTINSVQNSAFWFSNIVGKTFKTNC
jgi:transcriptional regulator with XRE-family HTH domain